MRAFVNICFHVLVKDEAEAEQLRLNPEMTPVAWVKLREQQAPNFPGEDVTIIVGGAFDDDDGADYWVPDND
jgi:hypothetical protein